jgi:hypothetical protein
MATLAELMEKFASASTAESDEATLSGGVPDAFDAGYPGATKIASGGDGMNTLQDIYMAIAENDHEKVAHRAAAAPEAPYNDDVDFAKMAAQIADAETEEVVAQESQNDIVKIASEYDAAGRIMARGFYDEFNKLAGNMDTDVSDNQMTESPSAASTPSLGDRGLPTVETNFAGTANHDQSMETAGSAPKQVYADSLKPKKTISAGQGTGDDPEAAAIGLGGGSPAGFATVRDLQA